MWILLLVACGSSAPESPEPSPPAANASPSPAPSPAPVGSEPAPAGGPHGAAAPRQASLGVFQGLLGDSHVVDGTMFLQLKGCEESLWVATDTPQPWEEGTTLVTLGGQERPATIPAVPGEPTVRFVQRIAPALEPLDCSLSARTGFEEVGRVLQSHVAGGYVYAELAYCDRVGWVAGPEAVLSKGQVVGHAAGTVQRGFVSRSLNRRFDEIVFVPSVGVLDADDMPCDG